MCSSASNVLALFALARVADVDSFGVVAFGFAVLTAALAVARGCFGTPILLMASRSSEETSKGTHHAVAGALLMGAIVGVPLVAVGVATGRASEAAILAAAGPIVLAQDVHRFSATALGRPGLALVWDGVWALGSGALLLTTWLTRSALSLHNVLVIWTGLAVASLLGLTRASGHRPVFGGLSTSWRGSFGKRIRYGLEAGVGSLSSLVVLSVAAFFVGPAAIAALRGAGAILGPLSVLMTAIPLAVLPEMLRGHHTPAETWRLLRRVAAFMSVLAVTIGTAGLVLPDSIGDLILGDSWPVAAVLLPITGLEYAGLAWISVMYSALRSQDRASDLLRSRLIHGTATVCLSAAAAWWWGTAMSVSWALATTAALVATALIVAYRPWAWAN